MVSRQLLEALVGMGHARAQATMALRLSNNHAAEAVALLQERPKMVCVLFLLYKLTTLTPTHDRHQK